MIKPIGNAGRHSRAAGREREIEYINGETFHQAKSNKKAK